MSVTKRADGREGGRLAARDIMVLLVFGSRLVQTAMRMAMGALVVYVCEEYTCNPAAKGWLLSAHAFGYCTTQVLGGALADRAGGRGVAGLALGVAGLALAATPLAPSLSSVLVLQVAMGAAMGPLFPSTMQVLAKWLPPQERGFASTALDSGITVGSLIVVPASSALALYVGWRAALAAFGLAAVAYSVLWAHWVVERPEACRFCSEAERVYIESGRPKEAPATATVAHTGGLSLGFQHLRFWAIYAAHFAFNYSIYFVNSWAATYYLEAFALRPEQAGLHLSLPHAANMLVKIGATPLVARALRARGVADLGCRRAFSGIGFVGTAACLALLPYASGSVHVTTVLFCGVLGFLALHPSGFKANYMDVTRNHGGVVSGVGNTIASVASSVGPLMVSQVRAVSGCWEPVFHAVAAVNILAALIFCSLSSATPIEADSSSLPAEFPSSKKPPWRMSFPRVVSMALKTD